jgi:hypothetical protein
MEPDTVSGTIKPQADSRINMIMLMSEYGKAFFSKTGSFATAF